MSTQRGTRRLSDVDLASRKSQEASLRRYEAALWLRKTVGVVVGKDLPSEPSEQDFRHGLRSGIILCSALNKVQPGAVPKIIEPPSDDATVSGGYLLTYQYFENVRNFIDAVDRLGIPTFEASDLEQGGNSSRIVDCILALKSYDDWKQSGGRGTWKYCGNSKSPPSDKPPRRRSDSVEAIVGSGGDDVLLSGKNLFHDLLEEKNIGPSFYRLFCQLLADKSHEDISAILENMLSNAVENFQCNAGKDERVTMISQAIVASESGKSRETEVTSMDHQQLSETAFRIVQSESLHADHQDLIEHLQTNIQDLKTQLHSTKEELQMLRAEYQQEVENISKHMSHLAKAASGYQKVLEENRKLYNQVQDLKGNIRVYCRVRPFLPGQPSCSSIVEDLGDTSITIAGKTKKAFTFNKVFGPSGSQDEVFADTQPLIRSVLDGYNVCIFAYGQTGSGKTYTMTGPKELTPESLGVNYRALNDLFLISEERRDTILYDISVQMIEIYNEQVRDLLSTDGQTKKLEIRNNSTNGINVPNANLIPVTSPSDVIKLMNLGHKNRAVGSTLMNDRSSRSHSCLTVHVQGRDLTSGEVLRGCMHLVDLAGSERIDKTEASGDRLKEAQHINKSLSALGDVISALAQKQSHVPYRNSKLTQLLQDSLGGQAKTLMFVHISPETDALGETISTLKFAERVSTIELGAARVNKAVLKTLSRDEGGDDDDADEMSVSSTVSRRLSMDSQEASFLTTPPEPKSSPDSINRSSRHIRNIPKVCLEPSLNKVAPRKIGEDNSPQGNQQNVVRKSGSPVNLAEQQKKRTNLKPGGSPVPWINRCSIPSPDSGRAARKPADVVAVPGRRPARDK